MSLRILVVDDHDVVRQGVRLILRSRADWQICGEASNGLEALEKVTELTPDLVILDISMPGKDGLEVAAEIQGKSPRPNVLIFTMHDSKELGAAVKSVGGKGYVTKSHAARDLVKAVQKIADGGEFFSLDTAPASDNPGSQGSGVDRSV